MRTTALAVTAAMISSAASADMITVTQTANVSGSITGFSFNDTELTITAIGDTDDRMNIGGVFVLLHSSVTLSLDGVGTFDVLDDTFTFVNNGVQRAGFGFTETMGLDGLDLLDTGPDAAFGSWDMLSSIGPVTTSDGILTQWDVIGGLNLTVGELYIDDADPVSNTFTAEVVPTPGTLAGLGFGGFFAARRRR